MMTKCSICRQQDKFYTWLVVNHPEFDYSIAFCGDCYEGFTESSWCPPDQYKYNYTESHVYADFAYERWRESDD